jgi:hypothetical protein
MLAACRSLDYVFAHDKIAAGVPISEKTMQFTPYLYFKGACEAALEFYAECGLGSIRELRRYEGTPMAGRDGGAWRNKVLHSQFEGFASTRRTAPIPNR